MDSPTQFQIEHPLSHKKFTKKMLGVLLQSFFIALVFAILIGSIMTLLIVSKNEAAGLWGVLGLNALFFFVFWGGILFLYGWYYKTYIARYYYDVGDQFITIKKGVFSPTEIHVQYQKIQDVYVDQDIMDRFMGIYDVHIASATVNSGIEAHIDGVDQVVAEKIKNLLLNRIQNPHSVTAAPAAAGATAVAPVAQSTTIQFAETFSSKTFPISGAWVFGVFASALVTSFVFVFFLGLFGLRAIDSVEALNAGTVIIAIIIYIITYIATVIRALIWRQVFYFEFLPQFIVIKDGIISREEKHIPYHTIQDVSSRQSILDRMLGIANVRIENAATQMVQSRYGATRRSGGLVIPGITVAQAEKIVSALKDVLAKTSSRSTGL